jgi:hypothetical protein
VGMLEELVGLLCCKVESLLMKYLGMPSGSSFEVMKRRILFKKDGEKTSRMDER